MEINNTILTFPQFLQNFYPDFEIDQANAPIIQNISLWALRDPNFNDLGVGMHLDKGLCIYGNVGSGKTELFLMLNRYLKYLMSPYVFSGQVVWKFASEFKKDGYDCFNKVLLEHKNVYFDELALTDENTDQPVREFVGHYGDRVIIGQELIMQMYNKFKETGYQAHFSTNSSTEVLERIYGRRAFSRLFEMCNMLTLIGEDKRYRVSPTFKNNRNLPLQPKNIAQDKVAEDETKRTIDSIYRDFVEKGTLEKHSSLIFNSLCSFNVNVCSEADMEEYKKQAAASYMPEISLSRASQTEQEANRNTYIWSESRRIALRKYFEFMKSKGAKTIFGMVEVEVGNLLTEENK